VFSIGTKKTTLVEGGGIGYTTVLDVSCEVGVFNIGGGYQGLGGA